MRNLKEIVAECENIVFLGGAGVSTESGIPDFRSENGLWRAKTKYECTPEELVSHTFFMRHTEAFYDFYLNHMLYPEAKPNAAHFALARLEAAGKVKAVVTQNIDGLHQKAGSRAVYELHGSAAKYFCMDCGERHNLKYVLDSARRRKNSCIPRCALCGGALKPEVILFGEPLDQSVMMDAMEAIERADALIVGGTSLAVYPAAGLVDYFKGKYLVLVNRQETPCDAKADLVIHDALGTVFAQL